MNGQWYGNFTGSSQGFIVINIDEMADHFEGEVALFDYNSELPNIAIFFETMSKGSPFHFETKKYFPLMKIQMRWLIG